MYFLENVFSKECALYTIMYKAWVARGGFITAVPITKLFAWGAITKLFAWGGGAHSRTSATERLRRKRKKM
jgi:hypothetical protein